MGFYRDKTVLITGGLGFMGSNLALRLDQLGARVRILDAELEFHGANYANIAEKKDNFEIVIGDIRDVEIVKKAVTGVDVIFNIAGQTSHVDSMVEPFLDNDINTRGHLVLLEACRKLNPSVRIVYAGTRAQYGSPQEIPVTELAPTIPLDIYGADKQTGEAYHFLYQKICGIRPTSLRINNTYGPRHQMMHAKYGVQNYLLRLAMDDQKIQIYGDGSQLRDLNYIDDVVEAFVLAGSSDVAIGEVYNLGSNSPVSFKKLVEIMIDVAGSGSYENVPFPEDRAKIETGDYVADISKIKDHLGWEPSVSLVDGMKRTVSYYRKYKKYYWK